MIYAAMILIVTGCILRVYAIKTLGNSFVLDLRIPTDIIQSGPYRYIRHPSYVGSLMILLGVGLISTLAAVMYLAIVFFAARAVEEEKIIRQIWTRQYDAYKLTAGMFWPVFPKFKERILVWPRKLSKKS